MFRLGRFEASRGMVMRFEPSGLLASWLTYLMCFFMLAISLFYTGEATLDLFRVEIWEPGILLFALRSEGERLA